MADGEEEAVDRQVVFLLVSLALAPYEVSTFQTVVAVETERVGLIEDFYLPVLLHALLHNLCGAEVRLADNHIDLVGQSGEVGGFLTGCVATAHHGHDLLAVEESVAGGAG